MRCGERTERRKSQDARREKIAVRTANSEVQVEVGTSDLGSCVDVPYVAFWDRRTFWDDSNAFSRRQRPLSHSLSLTLTSVIARIMAAPRDMAHGVMPPSMRLPAGPRPAWPHSRPCDDVHSHICSKSMGGLHNVGMAHHPLPMYAIYAWWTAHSHAAAAAAASKCCCCCCCCCCESAA